MQSNEKLLSTADVLKRLNVPMYRLRYLFQTGKLKDSDFIRLGNGHRIYRESDIPRIKEILFRMQNR